MRQASTEYSVRMVIACLSHERETAYTHARAGSVRINSPHGVHYKVLRLQQAHFAAKILASNQLTDPVAKVIPTTM